MADDYTLTTNEQGQDIYRDSEGRTLAPSDYASTYGPAVAQDMGTAPGGGIAGLAGLSGGVDTSGGGGILAQARDFIQNNPSGGFSGGVNVAPYINDLYQAVFNRPADVAGLQYYGSALMNGASMSEIEQSLRASSEYAGIQSGAVGGGAGGAGGAGATGGTVNAGTTANSMGLGTVSNTPVEDELAKYYTSEFGRAFDKPGLEFWAGKIRSGEVALGDVAKLFSTSPEGLKYDIANLAAGKTTDLGFVDPSLKGRYETLQDLYGKDTYRKGDMPGLEYWLGRNLTNEQYAKAFAESPEARVQDAYREVFGPTRGADEKGLKYYMDELASGKKYEDIIKAMKASDEYKKLTGGVITTPIVTKPVVNPVTGVTYSNAAQSAKAVNFGNFPLTSGTRVNEKGEVVPTVSLNLKARPKFNLGLPGFSTLGLTSYQENPASTNIFGGAAGTTGTAKVSEVTATPGVVDAAATTNQGVVTAAQGGMIMSDPVMRRAMFRNGGPVSSKGYGITSNVTTPDENAMAMQTMFQPQGFRDRGPVQYFQQGGEAEATEEPAPLTPLERLRAQTRTSEPRFKSVMDVYREGRMLPIDREQEYTGQSMRDLEEGVNPSPSRSMGDVVRDTARGVGDAVRGSTKGIGDFFDSIAERAKRNREAMNRSGPVVRMRSKPEVDALTEREQTETRTADLQRQASAQMAQRRQDIDDADRQRDNAAADAAKKTAADRREPPPDAERRIAERVPATTSLEKLKADREANKAQRKENQLLALMQAGFAMAAGRSPNALANLAAGGASGVATLAGLEKERRAEDALLRREILETELSQERTREARAERQAGREQTAAQRQLSLLQNVSANTRSEIQAISSDIIAYQAKLATMAQQGVPEAAMAEVKAEIEKLKIQREAAKEQRDSTFESLGIKRPKTPDQQGPGFKLLGPEK